MGLTVYLKKVLRNQTIIFLCEKYFSMEIMKTQRKEYFTGLMTFKIRPNL